MRERSTTLAASASGMLAAFLGALCCAGPIVLAMVGVGAGLASRVEPLRPVFGVIMLLSFALAYRRIYPARRDAMATNGEPVALGATAPELPAGCAVPSSRRRDRTLFWTAAAISLAMWTFPSWSGLLI